MEKNNIISPMIIFFILFSFCCTKNSSRESKSKIIELSGDLSFGSIVVNSNATKIFTITNSGTGSVSINSISVPSGFSVDWFSGTIEPSSSKQINVKFAPTQVQSYSGEMVVVSNADLSPSKIQVTGEAKNDIADFTSYKKNYFEADNSSYIQSALPASSPSSSSSPKISDVQGNSYVLTGGSNIISFRASNTVSSVLIGIDGVDGYYKINGRDLNVITANFYSLSLVMSQTLILQSIKFKIAYVDFNQQISNYYILNASEIKAGTGLLQINCSWQKHNDVDLHVIEPNGEEIYYGNRTSQNKGKLDVDSNPACSLDYRESENITYESGAFVEAGNYIVKANLYSACNVTVNTPVSFRVWYNGVLLKDGDGNTSFTINLSSTDANEGGLGYGKNAIVVKITQSQTARSVYMQNSIVPANNTKAGVFDFHSGKLLYFGFEVPNNNNNNKK